MTELISTHDKTNMKNFWEESFLLKMLKKFDVNKDNLFYKGLQTSFFLRTLNRLFLSVNIGISNITDKSFVVEKIDYFIMFGITILLMSLSFASTEAIGAIAVCCFIMFIIKLILKKGETLSFNTLDVPVISYILIAAVSAGFSMLFMPALKGYFKILIYFSSYLTFYNILKNKLNRTYYFLGVIGVVVYVQALIGIYQNYIGVEALASWQDESFVSPEYLMTRVYGTLQPLNPNLLAGFMLGSVMTFITLCSYFFMKQKYHTSILCFGAFLSVVYAIVLTGSRGAYIGLFVIVLMLFLISGYIIHHDYKEKTWLKKLWIYVLIGGMLAVFCLILSKPALQHRILSIFAFRADSSNSFRLNVYASCFSILKDHWFIGIGPGNEVFRLIYGLYMTTGFDALGAYSVPLEIAVESGIIAFLAFFWLIALIFIKSFKSIVKGPNLKHKILITSILLNIVAIMVHGTVDTVFFRPQVNLIFWMMVAIFAANVNNTEENYNS
jgi:putative inorganic carbon (HCO3(-)) transporter